MVLGRSISDSYILNIDDMNITSTDEVTLLGVTIDNKLTFRNHIDELCRKASNKLLILRRIRPFYQKKKLSYLKMLLLIVSLYGCLLLKVQLATSAKFISGHSKLFIMHMTNRTKSYLLPVMISLYIKNSFIFWR